MEQDPSSEVKPKLIEIENLVTQILESPDNISTVMGCRFEIPGSCSMDLKSEVIPNTMPELPLPDRHHTAIFLKLDDTGVDRIPATPSHFSVLYDYLNQSLHGVQLLTPDRLRYPHELLPPLPSIVFDRTVEVLNYVHGQGMVQEDGDFRGSFDIPVSDMDPTLSKAVELLIESTHQALANGALYERRDKSCPVEDGTIWVETNIITGPSEHFLVVGSSIANIPLHLSFHEGGVSYVLDRTQSGAYEAKVQLTDLTERYRDYASFDPKVNEETGDVIAYRIDHREVEQREQEEREAGLYEPTKEKVELFLGKLRQAA